MRRRATSSAIGIASTRTVAIRRMRAMGIRDEHRSRPRLGRMGLLNGSIGSIRRECVDHFLVLREAHLRRILRAYARYYNDVRTHRPLDKDCTGLSPRCSGSDLSMHTRSLADFITIMCGFRFSVHTPLRDPICKAWTNEPDQFKRKPIQLTSGLHSLFPIA